MTRETYDQLCSSRWFAPDDQRSSDHRSRTLQKGYDPADWEGKPVIAVINTWSDTQPCQPISRIAWSERPAGERVSG